MLTIDMHLWKIPSYPWAQTVPCDPCSGVSHHVSKHALLVSGGVLIIAEQIMYHRLFAALYLFANQDVDVLCDGVNL